MDQRPDKAQPVNHMMVALARESRGLTQSELARRVGTSQGQLSKIEAGVLPVTTELLEGLARELSYPENFFKQSDPVLGPGTTEFFHRKRQAVSARLLGKIHAQINIRRMNVARLLRSTELTIHNIPQFDLDEFHGAADEIARAVRATWQLARGPIPQLTRTIEDAGGIVVACDFETTLVDAVSRWVPGLPPLFFLNQNMPGDRQRLSLAHELGHIVMHQTPRAEMEDEAYRFAAELLMPAADIRTSLDDLTLERLAALKPFWRVSMAALLKRADDLGRISPRRARTLWMQLGKAGLRVREPSEVAVPVEQGSLISEMLGVHRQEFGYTLEQISDLLALNADEIRDTFGVTWSPVEARSRLRILGAAS